LDSLFFFCKYPHSIEAVLHDSYVCVFFFSVGATYLSRLGFRWFLYGQNSNQSLVQDSCPFTGEQTLGHTDCQRAVKLGQKRFFLETITASDGVSW
jgi:hypothetical protein